MIKKLVGGGVRKYLSITNPYEGRLQDVVSFSKGGVNL